MFGICGKQPLTQPSPREEQGEGEVIDRRCRLNLNSSLTSSASDRRGVLGKWLRSPVHDERCRTSSVGPMNGLNAFERQYRTTEPWR